MISELFSFSILAEGGWVAQVLALLGLAMGYTMAYRYFLLRSPFAQAEVERLLSLNEPAKDVLSQAVTKMLQVSHSRNSRKQGEYLFICKQVADHIRQHKSALRSIVVVAPLLGLLGTVQGMIETFDSLQDAALFSQSGGIAGGISQALITTQMGLVVAIPGLLIGRRLDHQENQINGQMERVMGQLMLQEGDYEVAT